MIQQDYIDSVPSFASWTSVRLMEWLMGLVHLDLTYLASERVRKASGSRPIRALGTLLYEV